MAYKFQNGNAKLDGEISGSSFRTAGSLSGSGDLAVTGNMHAAVFYGSGAGITGISSDAVDVTASLGASQVYGFVGTQGTQTNGSLGLITTVSGASFNPLDAAWGSKLLLSGSNGGEQASAVHFGNEGGLGLKAHDDGEGGTSLLLQLTSSQGGIDVSGSHDDGIALYVGQGAQSGVSVVQSNFYVFPDEESNYNFQVSYADGAISGSGGMVLVGSISSSGDLAVTGAVHAANLYGDGSGITGISSDAVDVTAASGDLAYPLVFTEGAQSDGSLGLGLNTALNYNPNDGRLSSSAGVQFGGAAILGAALNVTGVASLDGGINVNDAYTVSTAGAVVANEFKTDGNEFVVSTAGLVTTTGLTNAGAVISSSQAAEIVGNSRLVGNVGVTGAISLDANGGGINWDGGSNVIKITNNGGNTMGFGAGQFHFNNLVSGSGGLQVVGAALLGNSLGVTGSVTLESGSFNKGYRKYSVTTITANTELSASTSKSYQIVSGGTSNLTVILPSASAAQFHQYGIKRHTRMSGNVIIEGSSAELIDGETNVTLSSANAAVFLISDGTQWNIF